MGSILTFLHCLKAEQALTDVKLAKRLTRERPEPRAPKLIRYDERLQRIVESYDDYTNVLDFLKAVGSMTML